MFRRFYHVIIISVLGLIATATYAAAVPVHSSLDSAHYIQVGAYVDYADAERQLKYAERVSTYPVSIRQVKYRNRSLFKVWVGPFSTKARVIAAQRQLNNAGMRQTVLISNKPTLTKMKATSNLTRTINKLPLLSKPSTPKNFPVLASSVVSPSAMGSTNRAFFVSFGYLRNWALNDQYAGSALVGLSLGNARKDLGLVVTTSTPFIESGDFSFEDHTLGFRINRYLSKNTAIAAGISNAAGTGKLKSIAKSPYLVLSTDIEQFKLPLLASIGFGAGAYHSVDDGINGTDKKLGLFGSLSIGFSPHFAVAADWNAKALSLGGCYLLQLLTKQPIMLNVSFLNVAGTLPSRFKRGSLASSITYATSF